MTDERKSQYDDLVQKLLELGAAIEATGLPWGLLDPAADAINSQLSSELREGAAGDLGRALDALAEAVDGVRALQRAWLGGVVAIASHRVGLPEEHAIIVGRVVVAVVAAPIDTSLLAVALSVRATGACLGFELPDLDRRLHELGVTDLDPVPDRTSEIERLLLGDVWADSDQLDVERWLRAIGILTLNEVRGGRLKAREQERSEPNRLEPTPKSLLYDRRRHPGDDGVEPPAPGGM
jgi:hypothetical protein